MKSSAFLLKNIDQLAEIENQYKGCIVVVYCKTGRLDIELNHENWQLLANDLLICPMDAMIGQFSHSADFDGCVYGAPSHSLDSLFYHCLRLDNDWWQKFDFVRQHPVIHLNDSRLEKCSHLHELMKLYVNSNNPYSEHQLDLIKQMFLYEILTWISDYDQHQDNQIQKERVPTRDAIIMQFLYLIKAHCKEEREVRWYAARMRITPKYLSTVARQVTGKTATEMIREGVLREIEELLLHSDKDVKQIAYELHFANESFFCKYVRENLGMPPLAYRTQSRYNN